MPGTSRSSGGPSVVADRRRLFEVGAIIESPSFYPYLSGRENLRALAGSGAPVRRQRIEELLELVGLRERAGDKVSRYSLGMKQRLGIAGALLNDPRPAPPRRARQRSRPGRHRRAPRDAPLPRGQGKTVFVSSHLLSEVQQLADSPGIIDRGRLIREGSIAELLATGGVVRVRVTEAEVGHARPRSWARLPGRTPCAGATRSPARWRSPSTRVARPRSIARSPRRASTPPASRRGSDLESIFLELTDEGSTTTADGVRSLGQAGVRLLGSHLRRLVRRPASWITLGMLAAMIGLVFIALAASAEQAAAQPGGEAILQLLTFPIAYTFVLAFVIQIGSLFAVIYFAAVAGSEWNWGTFKNAVARGESRSRYVLAGYVALGLLAGLGLLIVFAVGVGAAIVGAGIAGVGTGGIGDQDALLGLPNQLWRAWLALAEAGGHRFRLRHARPEPAGGRRRRASRSTSSRSSPACSCRTSCAGCPSTPPRPSSRAPT